MCGTWRCKSTAISCRWALGLLVSSSLHITSLSPLWGRVLLPCASPVSDRNPSLGSKDVVHILKVQALLSKLIHSYLKRIFKSDGSPKSGHTRPRECTPAIWNSQDLPNQLNIAAGWESKRLFQGCLIKSGANRALGVKGAQPREVPHWGQGASHHNFTAPNSFLVHPTLSWTSGLSILASVSSSEEN